MKTKMIGAALALMMTSGVASAFTERECEKVWSKENWALAKQVPQPDFTCVVLTHQLLVSLQGATRAQVIKAMKANGRPWEHDTVLHFLSVPNGAVNFGFENDKVVRIFGSMDDMPGGINFLWNPAQSIACSDLRGSHYARCNKQEGNQ
jgi:hypothetical protein